MKSLAATKITVSVCAGDDNLSIAQKTFNQLVKKIEQERLQLAKWQEAMSLYQQKYSSQVSPLMKSLDECRKKLIHALDEAYPAKTFSKNDKEKMSSLICTLSEQLIAKGQGEEIKVIYNKYSDIDFDTVYEEEKQFAKERIEDVLGIDLGDDCDFSSPEAMAAHIDEIMEKKRIEEEQFQDKTRQKSTHKKSAKVKAQEAKEQEEAQNISKSIREVYRKLASVLHPDREQDITERTRKTALMQRVNVAYANKDLLVLLELQLEVEQIDQSMINTLSEERLAYYNKILTEQFYELRCEVDDVRFSFGAHFNVPLSYLSSPSKPIKCLKESVQGLQQDIAMIKQDLSSFADLRNIKAWLKFF